MTATDQHLREGFGRQRRSLLVVSLALLAFQQVGATLHELNILGNRIDLSTPLPVTLPLWVAWAYFLIRYYQYFRDLGDTGLRDVMWKHHERLAKSLATKKLAASMRPDLEGFERPEWKVTVDHLLVVGNPHAWWQMIASGHFDIADRGNPTKAAVQYFERTDVTLKPGVPRLPRLRGFLWAVLHTRIGTEYGLPFVLAGVPVVRALGVRAAAWLAVF